MNLWALVYFKIFLAVDDTPLVDVKRLHFLRAKLAGHHRKYRRAATGIHDALTLMIHRHLALYHQVGSLMVSRSKGHLRCDDYFVWILFCDLMKVCANQTFVIYDD